MGCAVGSFMLHYRLRGVQVYECKPRKLKMSLFSALCIILTGVNRCQKGAV